MDLQDTFARTTSIEKKKKTSILIRFNSGCVELAYSVGILRITTYLFCQRSVDRADPTHTDPDYPVPFLGETIIMQR